MLANHPPRMPGAPAPAMSDHPQLAAAYPANNTEELQAVVTFLGLLDLAHIKPDPKWLDKIPNTDGQVELVDDAQKPLGKLEIQIKKIPDGDTSFQCPVALIDYSDRSLLPLLLVCVDVGNKVAYFRHLHRGMMPDLPPAQASFVIHFGPTVHAISPKNQYLRQWVEIIEERKKRISDYPRLSQIAARLDLAHISKEDRIYFQQYTENLNRFLELDFPAVKERLFDGVWKLGAAVFSADPRQLCFQLYTIFPGDPDIRVSGIAQPPPNLSPPSGAVAAWWQGAPGGTIVQHNWISRSTLKSPLPQAQEFVLKHVEEMVRARSFPLCGKLLATEYLFWFVDNYGESIGGQKSDRLNVRELNYGVSVFLPVWCSLAVPRFLGEIDRLNHNNLSQVAHMLAAPPFEHVACAYPRTLRPTKEEVMQVIQSGQSLNPVRLRFTEASLQLLTNSVDFLTAANQEFIERPYQPASGHGPRIWSGYTVEALRHNAPRILLESLDEYRVFVQRNRIPLKHSTYLHQPTATILTANLQSWTDPHITPALDIYLARNDDQKLPRVSFADLSQCPDQLRVENHSLTFQGTKRELLGKGGQLATDLFTHRPMLERIYQMLSQDLRAEYPGYHFS